MTRLRRLLEVDGEPAGDDGAVPAPSPDLRGARSLLYERTDPERTIGTKKWLPRPRQMEPENEREKRTIEVLTKCAVQQMEALADAIEQTLGVRPA